MGPADLREKQRCNASQSWRCRWEFADRVHFIPPVARDQLVSVLSGGRCGDHAVPIGVVWPGCRRSPIMWRSGNRRRGRWTSVHHRRRKYQGSWSRATTRSTMPPHIDRVLGDPVLRTTWRQVLWRTRHASRGRPPSPDCSNSTPGSPIARSSYGSARLLNRVENALSDVSFSHPRRYGTNREKNPSTTCKHPLCTTPCG